MRNLEELDYIWVEASYDGRRVEGLDLGECENIYMPYNGEHLYPIGVVMTLLKDDQIRATGCKWVLRAARGIDPKVVKEAATKMQDSITEAAWEHVELLQEALDKVLFFFK